jgi:hypothetical protein
MRFWKAIALCALLGGCSASKQKVVARLGQEYIGPPIEGLERQARNIAKLASSPSPLELSHSLTPRTMIFAQTAW